MTDEPQQPTSPAENNAAGRSWPLVVLAVAVVAIAAWRSTVGVSALDDSHYVAIVLRLAQGARPLADEWTLQVMGFFAAVPVAKAWTSVVGLTGLALVLRLTYVALATGAWYLAYRALRPTFGRWPSALACAAPILAPPFGILMVSYNTGALLGFLLATCLGFAALRDKSVGYAVGAGLAVAFAGCSYPPLAIVSLVFLVVLTILARREPRVVLGLWAAAVALGLAAGAALLVSATPAQIGDALNYSRSTWADMIPPALRLSSGASRAGIAATVPGAWALWALAVLAAWPMRNRRPGAIAAMLLAVAAAVPGIVGYATGVFKTFGTTGAAYLAYFTIAALIPVISRAIRTRDAETRQMLVLGGSAAVVGIPLVVYSTSAGWYWALPAITMSGLAAAVVLGWLRCVADGELRGLAGVAGGLLLAGVLSFLLGFTFVDGPPLGLSYRIPDGALAGLATTPGNGARILALEALGRRVVRPSDGVLFLGGPIGYLLVGGTMETNAVWLNPGRSDSATVDYLQRRHLEPRFVFVTSDIIAHDGGVLKALDNDPLLRSLKGRYSVGGSVPGYLYFERIAPR